MTREIPLTQGYVSLVDDEDYEELSKYKWQAAPIHQTVYARRFIRKPSGKVCILMHQQIMDAKGIDHIDRNGLNNQRHNLRIATRSQNARNIRAHIDSTSGYVGVSWCTRDRKWRAQIRRSDGKHKSLGYFTNEEDAARAYDKAAYERDPEFCNLNFPEEYGK